MEISKILCFIIPLITAIIGWLLGRFISTESEVEETNEELNQKITKLQGDLNACMQSKKKLSSDLDACLNSKSKLSATASTPSVDLGVANSIAAGGNITEPTLVFDPSAAKLALGKKVVADDLRIVEGIGPKISQLFNNNGVNTWYQLSKTSIERCQEILNSGGKRYEIHNPGSWPKQSGLAFEGKWKELNDLQDYLDGGVEPK